MTMGKKERCILTKGFHKPMLIYKNNNIKDNYGSEEISASFFFLIRRHLPNQ
jgi:hypothetical protein